MATFWSWKRGRGKMGSCVSTPERCVGGTLRSSKKKTRKRKKGIKRKVPSKLSDGPLDKLDYRSPVILPDHHRHSFTNNHAFQGPRTPLFLFLIKIWTFFIQFLPFFFIVSYDKFGWILLCNILLVLCSCVTNCGCFLLVLDL